ncbi:MAG TPA: MFS transporter [Pirellulales bacterium]|jgi:MFS family permease|nr:MFS transporter [Pirellulales bacterium]
MASTLAPSALAPPWYKELTRYHWFVFVVAALGWLFDCLDQQLFVIARNPAIEDLLKTADPVYAPLFQSGTISDAQKAEFVSLAKTWGGNATAIFVAGWATGGLLFGALGDRIGRAKMLTVCVLLYSVFTGLSALSDNVQQFCGYRFVTGLGVGGVFGLAVALVADSLPDRARPYALGLLQALSAVGNIAAGVLAVVVGWMQVAAVRGGSSPTTDFWKYLFWIGAAPAFLCVFIQIRLREPEKWVKAREAGRATGVKFGSYAALFGDSRWRKAALLGMLLCVSGVVGLWGVGFFSPELIGDVTAKHLKSANVPEGEVPGTKMMWTGINMILQNFGAFLGMMAFTKLAQRFGRKPVFAVFFVLAFLSTAFTFKFLSETWHIFTLIPLMGFCQLGLFAGFAIYLPELFPTSLRSTGTSFCYNVGRFLAASGPFTLGILQARLAAGATTTEARLEAFRNACAYVSVVFLVGLVALLFLPETKGKPLPE